MVSGTLGGHVRNSAAGLRGGRLRLSSQLSPRVCCCAWAASALCVRASMVSCVRAHPGRTGKGPLVASPRDVRPAR
eukprot:4631285-Prymnesium_polylepis.1